MLSCRLVLLSYLAVCAGMPEVAWAGITSPTASAEGSRLALSGTIGYAYPVGSAETGTETRDVSFGLVPVSFRATYDLPRGWDGSARIGYGVNIPTLCASGPDCEASLGHEVALAVGIGRTLSSWRRFTPHIGLDLGWEWLTTRLSDSGVSASRRWNGPAAGLQLFVDMRSRGLWRLGPAFGIDVGWFRRFDLDLPTGHAGGSTEAELHAWPSIAFRVERRL